MSQTLPPFKFSKAVEVQYGRKRLSQYADIKCSRRCFVGVKFFLIVEVVVAEKKIKVLLKKVQSVSNSNQYRKITFIFQIPDFVKHISALETTQYNFINPIKH